MKISIRELIRSSGCVQFTGVKSVHRSLHGLIPWECTPAEDATSFVDNRCPRFSLSQFCCYSRTHERVEVFEKWPQRPEFGKCSGVATTRKQLQFACDFICSETTAGVHLSCARRCSEWEVLRHSISRTYEHWWDTNATGIHYIETCYILRSIFRTANALSMSSSLSSIGLQHFPFDFLLPSLLSVTFRTIRSTLLNYTPAGAVHYTRRYRGSCV